jgi:hypothetical protein
MAPMAPKPPVVSSFSDFCASLPEWEADLLTGVTETLSSTPLFTILTRPGEILAVSDGSDDHRDHGTFGWVIGNESEVFWTGSGLVRGSPMSSFRAEAYGRLSLLRFMLRYLEFWTMTSHSECYLRTALDNMGVIKRHQRHATQTSLQCLAPDFDTIEMIEQTLAALPLLVTTEHVRGHQDDSLSFAELSRPAQLNVMADQQAADAYHNRQDSDFEKFYPLPSGAVYLARHDTTLTSHETRVLRSDLLEFHLLEYICDHNQWSREHLHSVNWEAYASARRLLRDPQQIFTTKLATDWLPTHAQLHRQGKTSTAACIDCGAAETTAHLLKCPARIPWRRKFLTNLNRHLRTSRTEPSLAQSILSNITKWFHGQPHDDAAPGLTWTHCFQGYLPYNWGHRQEKYYDMLPSDTPEFWSGTLWTKRLIQFLWEASSDSWHIRNETLHGGASQLGRERGRHEAEVRIRAMYDIAPELLVADRRIFDRPLATVLSCRTREMEAWIRTREPILRQGVVSAKANAREHTHDIRKFFQPRSH